VVIVALEVLAGDFHKVQSFERRHTCMRTRSSAAAAAASSTDHSLGGGRGGRGAAIGGGALTCPLMVVRWHRVAVDEVRNARQITAALRDKWCAARYLLCVPLAPLPLGPPKDMWVGDDFLGGGSL